MKDDGFVKKTQDAINEKVVPAAKEGFETAQDLFEKSAHKVGDFLKDAGKKTEHVAETAGEKSKSVRKDAADALSRTGDKLVATKNDAFAHFKKEAEDTADKAADLKTDLKKEAKSKKREAVDFTKNKADQIEVPGTQKKGKKVVKTAAGVAVLAAAAAGAYGYYKMRKDKENAIKAEFSEKMKKWNELGESELAETKTEVPFKMHVRPNRVYKIGDNALLGEDIILNVTFPGEDLEGFNPDEVSEAINPVEEIRKKAEEALGTAGTKAKQVADTVTEKAKEAYYIAAEKADELKDKMAEKSHEVRDEADGFIQDIEEGLEAREQDLQEGFKDAKEVAKELAEEAEEKKKDLADQAEDKLDDAKEKLAETSQDLKEETDEFVQDVEEGLEARNKDLDEGIERAKEKAQEVADDAEDLLENKMESDETDDLLDENLVENPQDLDNISWDEDESLIMQKTEDLRHKTSEGIDTLKEKLHDAKEYLEDRYNRMMPTDEEVEEDFFTEELQVLIHNKGNKDYFFSPMLIQRYNSAKRETAPIPVHEEGTTLEQRIIKPGETYQGTIFLKMSYTDDAVIMFEDMLMKSSVAVLLNEEMDDLFLEEESFDLQDDFLFEGIEGDFDLEELDIEEAEELNYDFADDELNQ